MNNPTIVDTFDTWAVFKTLVGGWLFGITLSNTMRKYKEYNKLWTGNPYQLNQYKGTTFLVLNTSQM